jgi:hypothetical protein
MAYITVTNTLVNGNTADAGELNTNFTDIINGTSDGSKDLNIAALTCAGNVTFNANTTIGNATSDTVTFTARAASDFLPSADSTYDLGSSSLAFAEVHTDLIVANAATDSVAGLVDTNDQTFGGVKTFSDGVDVADVTGGNVIGGTYTPTTGTGTSGYSSLSTRTHTYTRIGNIVTVAGEIQYTATAASVILSLQLPIDRISTSSLDCRGGSSWANDTMTSARILGHSGYSNYFQIIMGTAGSGTQTVGYCFQYEIQ